MPFRPPTFGFARWQGSSLLQRPRSSSTVTHLGLCHVRLLPELRVDRREISVVAVGSRGLSSLNWLRSSLPFARRKSQVFKRAYWAPQKDDDEQESVCGQSVI